MLSLVVNGQRLSVDTPEGTPLLWVLRNHLGLTGTKFGCGAAVCGACTVHIDGVAERSCSITVGDVQEKKITTIEGLDPNGGHPLQKAWIAEQVPQLAEILKMRRQLEELLGFMDGRVDAEKRIAQLLNNEPLLSKIASQAMSDDDKVEE